MPPEYLRDILRQDLLVHKRFRGAVVEGGGFIVGFSAHLRSSKEGLSRAVQIKWHIPFSDASKRGFFHRVCVVNARFLACDANPQKNLKWEFSARSSGWNASTLRSTYFTCCGQIGGEAGSGVLGRKGWGGVRGLGGGGQAAPSKKRREGPFLQGSQVQ